MYPIIIAIFILPLLLTIYDAFQNKTHLLNELNSNADQLMNISAAAAEDAFWTYNNISLEQIANAVSEYKEVAIINILDENNRVIFGTNKKGNQYEAFYLNPLMVREVYREDVKIGEIHIVFTSYYLNREINAEILLGFTRTLVISFITLVIVFFLTRNITLSIDNIDSGVQAFAEGDIDTRIQVKDKHEIKRLADRINRMFQTIVEADIKLKANYVKLHHLAYYDALTGLPNRAMLFDHVNKLFSDQNQKSIAGALIFMDLDDFKTINDTKGHPVGDQVLIQLASQLQEGISHDLIARIGGDEFVFLLKDCNISQVNYLAGEIINLVRKPREINEYEFLLSCSIGIVTFPEDGSEIDTLLMKADSAMYQAKMGGKDQYKFYDQSINDQMVKKINMQNEIRQGIMNKEFLLHYQPQIDLGSGKLIGVEALVRWQHPIHGLLMPGDFIGLAEETGLIIPLGEYILKSACAQSVEWENKGIEDVKMSVNISAKQINNKNIVYDILRIVEEMQMKPEQLMLEITESIAMENLDHTLSVMNNLREKGISFSLDDFGTGYSSLNYLKNIPIHHLKVDKQFVQNLGRQSFEDVVVRAIIDIAHSMNLIVVAEGIETSEQKEALISYNCDLAQGYYFSRPIPKQEVEVLMRNGFSNN